MKVYVITTNTDLCEGRGTQTPTEVIFSRIGAALEYTKSAHFAQYAVQGYVNTEKGHPENIRELKVFTSFSEAETEEDLFKANSIKNKLTEEELSYLKEHLNDI